MNKDLKMESTTFSSANILTVEAGTNTPMGGDAGHGGKTVFTLVNKGATAWKAVVVAEDGKKAAFDEPTEVTIELYGDTEAITFINSLLFAVSTLTKQNSGFK